MTPDSPSLGQQRKGPSPLQLLADAIGDLEPIAVRELSRAELLQIRSEINTNAAGRKDLDVYRSVHNVEAGRELKFQVGEGPDAEAVTVLLLDTDETFSGHFTSRRLSITRGEEQLVSYLGHPNHDEFKALQSLRHFCVPQEAASTVGIFDRLRMPDFRRLFFGDATEATAPAEDRVS